MAELSKSCLESRYRSPHGAVPVVMRFLTVYTKQIHAELVASYRTGGKLRMQMSVCVLRRFYLWEFLAVT